MNDNNNKFSEYLEFLVDLKTQEKENYKVLMYLKYGIYVEEE